MNRRQRRIRRLAAKFDAGRFVRISKCQFTNGAEQNYCQEQKLDFTKVFHSTPRRFYELEGLNKILIY
jgi:hypothetical protein